MPIGCVKRQTMVARLAAFGLVLSVLAVPARADFEAGLTAYQAGDYAAAYREWLPLARGGDPAAQRNIGQLYRLGRGVARDPSIAAEWYLRAAKLGLGRAQANLAMLYLLGDGVGQDYTAAGKWFKAAAVQGHVIAQFNLGIMYERGLGFERDNAKARAWYNLAAKAGHRRALDNLSRLVAADTFDELTDPERKAKTAPAAEGFAPSAPPDDTPASASRHAAYDEASIDAPSSAEETGGLFGFLGRLFSSDDPAQDADEVPTAAETPEPPAPATPPAPIEPVTSDSAVAATDDPSPAASSETAESPTDSGRSLIGSLTALFSGDPANPPATADATRDGIALPTGAIEPAPGSTMVEPVAVDSVIANQPTTPPDTKIPVPVEAHAAAADDGGGEEPRKGFFSRIFGIFGDADSEQPADQMTDALADPVADLVADPVARAGGAMAAEDAAPSQVTAALRPAPREPISADDAAAANAATGMRAYRQGDFQVALANWLPLAQAGDPNAQYLVGGMFLTGAGVPPDLARAHMWWRLSSARGHPRASRDMDALRTRMNPEQLAESDRLASDWQAAR